MPTATKKKILLIEDDSLIRTTISSYLQEHDFEITTAENGGEGLDLFAKKRPDIVLTDLRMPVVDGLEVLAKIRKKSPDTPVIIVSGMGTMADAIESLKLGAWDYITKPIQDFNILSNAVNKAVEIANLRKLKKRYQEHLQDEVQKRTEEIEEQNKEIRQLSQAVEQSGSTIVMTDLKGNIVYVNHAFEESTGYSREEAIGQNPRILKTDYLDYSIYENLWETISSGGIWRGLFNNKRKDGSTYWEKAVISPVCDDTGTIVNFMAVKEDITLIREAEQKMIAAKKKAEDANETKNRFLNNISHELRTPLNGIMGYVSLLQSESGVSGEHKEWLNVIEKSSVDLNDLITKIIQFSELNVNDEEIKNTKFSPAVLTHNIYQLLKPEAETKGLVFIYSAPGILPEHVIGDQH
ncbi:MAG: response regulator, partial [Deltaproteobacteria bacterium]|nr:response regulator [Deltaproteobacteria bacterium]